jgi:hypothetical protein
MFEYETAFVDEMISTFVVSGPNAGWKTTDMVCERGERGIM